MNDINQIWRVAFTCLVALIIGSVGAGFALQDAGLLDIRPPATWENPTPDPDITAANRMPLYIGTFIGWASIVLLLPVYLFVWSAGKGEVDKTSWLAFWATAFLAYVAFLMVWMLWFFGADFAELSTSSRLPSLVLLFGLAGIWAIDIKLAMRKVNTIAALIFRTFVHACVLIFFFIDIGMASELNIGKLLGMALLASLITGLTLKLRDLTKRKAA